MNRNSSPDQSSCRVVFDFSREVGIVEGWLTESEGIFLYNAAKRVRPKNIIVEIGSWKGKSTICLARGSQNGNMTTVYAVDPHTGSSEHQQWLGRVNTFRDFTENIKKAELSGYIEVIRETSENAARKFTKPIEFIFIDGAHEYDFVRLDFDVWFPRVIDGGLMAFHDSWHFWGPNLVTAVQLLVSSQIRKPRLIDTITCFEKVRKNSLVDRYNNVGFVLYRTLFGIIGFLKLKYHLGKGSR